MWRVKIFFAHAPYSIIFLVLLPISILRTAKEKLLTFILTKSLPVLISKVTPGAVFGEGLDAFLRQHAHIDLKPHQSEHTE